MRCRWGWSYGMLLAIVLALTAAGPTQAANFPGATWEFRSPAAVGLDSAKLDQFAQNVGGGGAIVKDGYMVKTWGNQIGKADWASAAKPVISTLLFFAVHEGKLASIDALIKDWGWALNSKDQSMTFQHLANMTSGYARGEAPGTAWAYNDYAISLYCKTMQKVFNASLDAAAAQRFAPLQLQDGSLFTSRGGCGVSTSVRDFARIGWFWLNGGNWNGTQLLPQGFFDNYKKPRVPGNLPRSKAGTSDYLGVGTVGGGSDQTQYGPGIYGLNWWFNNKGGVHPTGLTWPNAPVDTFQANGHWNVEVMTIIPSLNMVVAARGNWGTFQPGNAGASMNQNLKLLTEAAVAPDTIPPAPPTALRQQ
jgi:CubicO group peptidase (beta-lactamase class C family)